MTEEITREGDVERTTYEEERKGFRIIKMKGEDGKVIAVKGYFPKVLPGSRIRVTGKLEVHAEYGEQIVATTVIDMQPSTLEGLQKYLANLVPGVGPKTAERIVSFLGETAIAKFDDLNGYLMVPGIRPEILTNLKTAWHENKVSAEVMVFLESHGCSHALATKIYQRYGRNTVSTVCAAPYLLADSKKNGGVTGVGFQTADEFARSLGVDPESEQRLEGGLMFVAKDLVEQEGHVCLTTSQLLQKAKKLMGLEEIEEGPLEAAIETLVRNKQLIQEDDYYFLPYLHQAEQMLAENIVRIDGAVVQTAGSRQISFVPEVDLRDWIAEFEKGNVSGDGKPLRLSEEQKEAVLEAMVRSFLVITGGPGVGKTTIIRTLLYLFEKQSKTVCLCAPTGRAAKRMEELTGNLAATIHRTLDYGPLEEMEEEPPVRSGITVDMKRLNDKQREDAKKKARALEKESEAGSGRGRMGFRLSELDADVLIADECSMIDMELACSLFVRVREGTKVILVGDVDQLPSVGAGAVLRDIINSSIGKTCKLTRIYRQGESSLITSNAHRVNRGELPESAPQGTTTDFYRIDRLSPKSAQETILELVTEKIPKAFKVLPRDIQVLVPMKKGDCGNERLNEKLQEALNPRNESDGYVWLAHQEFRVRDKVLQMKNDYEREIFNGEIGYVVKVNSGDDSLVVKYEGDKRGTFREVEYDKESLRHLKLAYSMTIHKCVDPKTLVESSEGLLPIMMLDREGGKVATPDGVRAYDGFVETRAGGLLEVVTKDGYRVKVTPDHGMDVWVQDGFRRVEAGDIRPGALLRLKMGVTCDVRKAASLPDPPEMVKQAKRYRFPRKVTEDLAEFLGLMVADGTVFKGGFRLVKRHKDVRDRFAVLCKALFGVEAHDVKVKNAHGAEVCSTEIVGWLRRVGGMDPEAKAVPLCVLRSSAPLQAAFLKGVFEDGCVNLKDGGMDHIEFSTMYPQLEVCIRTMLLRLGIISGSTPKRPGFIYIYGRNASRFREKVGFVSGFKRSRTENKTGDEIRYMLPISREEARRFRSTLMDIGLMSKSAVCNIQQRLRISRHEAECVLARASSMVGGIKRLPNVVRKDLRLLEDRLGFHYSAVRKISRCEGPSMCLQVPDGHRFLQNGFAGWNSQGSEYPVVVVAMLQSHYVMCSRKLLYTGLTRGKKLVILVTDNKALQVAVSEVRMGERNTKLVEKIHAHRGSAVNPRDMAPRTDLIMPEDVDEDAEVPRKAKGRK
jgi:exodeoxyribonuclease V alpha subunit